MSKAGIYSNRGDGYQTLVAFNWALFVLDSPEYEWLEVDSVTWAVDDVVIGRSDGSKICCQCKKNQTQYKAWSISDLKDELCKAISLLSKDHDTTIRFYSRSNFGDLAALREFSSAYADESAYKHALGKAHKVTDNELATLLTENQSSLSTYLFLKRVAFEVSPELDTMDELLHERLRRLVSNHKATYNVLWRHLDQLGFRFSGKNVSTQHRLTKDDLKALVIKAGSILTPPIEINEIRSSFQGTSAIGRSWRRDIGSEYISSPVVNELIEAIEAKHRSILLTGMPGSGKTCVMLAVQDELERIAQNRTNIQPLFIQSREFADITTTQDRQAQGLPEHWVESAARMAEEAHVVVMIDSLDVLSIAREHNVLGYFLAQIDRLLLIQNVTVVTSCREFDLHYDRRIARRSWDMKITCKSLSWDFDIEPLLAKLGINAVTIDSITRELISNPRELALFVELAQKGGGFNVVTSQALAQYYLATIVQANDLLGDVAMQAIERMAANMLKLRSLSIPYQHFTASQEIKRELLSNKVLHEMQDGQLTFGHQTLLDVLVISGAIRQAVTLNQFINNLPQVPFVRSSIRSFVAQLGAGDRRELRKQLRAVLTGRNAFHIRRLVAETFSEQIPSEDDWPLIRDLHSQHREVFQVIYAHASRVEWHHFWMRNLVPFLKESNDFEGIEAHAHKVSKWKNDDATSVIGFWSEVLTINEIDKTQLANSIGLYIEEIHVEHLKLCSPLLVKLLMLPKDRRSFLGHAIARCVEFGDLEEALLWNYISGDVTDDDVKIFHLNNKLHCDSSEFGTGKEKFLSDRMRKSTVLLDFAIAAIERWSNIKNSNYSESLSIFWHGFLGETSYSDSHRDDDSKFISSERILLDAVEGAILHHAASGSFWWKNNRERLCFNKEGALRYFAILACTAMPIANLDLISRMLCEKELLESTLSYELGTLMQAAFIYLDSVVQDTIQAVILTIRVEAWSEPNNRKWVLQAQAEFALAVPCQLRSVKVQAVLYEYEREKWPLVREPCINVRSGMVAAPFSFEVFLDASDSGVARLLHHYTGYERSSFDDFLVGGEREVGWQLREASSRAPIRFINFLSLYWEQISNEFRDYIMSGIANYLAHLYGNLSSNETWSPKESPDVEALVQKIIDELENHLTYWHHNRSASEAIESCAHIVIQPKETSRLVSLAANFSTLVEESSGSGNAIDLITTGINMAKGNAAEAVMILANKLDEKKILWPESLSNTLRLYAADKHPAIRALLLRRLPYLQSNNAELGWELFDLAMRDSAAELWSTAESCLYYAYYKNFEKIVSWLQKMYNEGGGKNLEIWGRISALAAISNRLDFSVFIENLQAAKSIDAWCGASGVWTHAGNFHQHRNDCIKGIEAGLNEENTYAIVVARQLKNLCREKTPLILVPLNFIKHCFCLLETEIEPTKNDMFGFDEWLSAISLKDPVYALEVTEIYLEFVRRTKVYLYNHNNNLTHLLTRLFEHAEELEEVDAGAMLKRVVDVQDALLVLGVNGINDWLKAAER